MNSNSVRGGLAKAAVDLGKIVDMMDDLSDSIQFQTRMIRRVSEEAPENRIDVCGSNVRSISFSFDTIIKLIDLIYDEVESISEEVHELITITGEPELG